MEIHNSSAVSIDGTQYNFNYSSQPPIGIDNTPPRVELRKVVSPPRGSKKQKSTVWLGAVGDIDYIFDSVTVVHHPGMTRSAGSGAAPPDADYAFSFREGSRRTRALNPALVLDHLCRREVSFTLGLGPKGHFSSGGGSVQVILHYHASDGRQGYLPIHEPSPDAAKLSRILDSDVQYDGAIVTPAGLLRGVDEREHGEVATWDPICFESKFFRAGDGIDDLPSLALTPERARLNRLIEDLDSLDPLAQSLKAEERLGFDIFAGLVGGEYEKVLLDNYRTSGTGRSLTKTLQSLSIRHMLNPNGTLADFVSGATRTSPSDEWYLAGSDEAVTALVCHPVGKWVQAVVAIAERSLYGMSALRLVRERIGETELAIVDEFAWGRLDGWDADEWVEYLRWRGHQIEGNG
ncbi:MULTISPECIES: hypothetical protein [Streptomyces]|uniref:Uncharacterized protein n=1 Tax=Streptomyces lienomycini TaxID=284035 RepID=A0ABV9WXE7_9ACTN|nr:hypothetical protein [Streptomyces lienomycini]